MCDIQKTVKDNKEICVLIKPEAFDRGCVWRILAMIETNLGGIVYNQRVLYSTPSRSLVEEHYEEHRGKDFFDSVVSCIAEKRVLALSFRCKDNISHAEGIKALRDLSGASDPEVALPGSIRNTFGYKEEDGSIRNMIHVSDSVDACAREIYLWFGV